MFVCIGLILTDASVPMSVCLSFSLRLASHDVVVTTYSLVSKEIPVAKDGPGHHTKDSEYTVLVFSHLVWEKGCRVD